MDVWAQYKKYYNDLRYEANDSDMLKLCVGLSGTFFFWGGETQQKRLAVANCFEEFERLFADRIKWVLPVEDVSRREVMKGGKKVIPTVREYVATMDPDDELDWKISGGRSPDEASDCYMAVLTTRQWEIEVHNPLSWMTFAMPIEAVYGPDGDPNLFINFVRYCSEQLRPWHGSAGLASLLPHENSESCVAEFDLQQRYFGLDVVTGDFYLGNRLQTNLKGANWLTFFDQTFPSTVSREQWESLRATPGLQVWKAGHAYVIQAGEQPILGPVPDGVPLLYKAVSDVIKPMRLSPMESFHIGSMTGEIRFNERTSELWSRRFDAPGIWPPYPDQIEFHDVDDTVDEYAAETTSPPEPQPPAEPPRVDVISALPGQPCPRSGDWFSPFLRQSKHVEVGQSMPGPDRDASGNQVIWYLREERVF
ncbi:type VI immunity family protein [Burkholderia pyrrocinia]|uniref:type VI immunity family protein n=1 Tax=Burkholderia pyrrocinia TaxID=60550 RepID=UPI00158CE5A5|nr:type VI immunity family protein [Burkholderia pyrrocinia]